MRNIVGATQFIEAEAKKIPHPKGQGIQKY